MIPNGLVEEFQPAIPLRRVNPNFKINILYLSFNTTHINGFLTSLLSSLFVLVVIYINLGCVRLYLFIHLPNCRITVLAKVSGFCPCVVST